MRNRYQISLRVIFLSILAFAVALAVWRSESAGRLGLASDTWEELSSFSDGKLTFTCKSISDAEKLRTEVKQGRFLVLAESVIREKRPEAARSLTETSIHAEQDGKIVTVYYTWDHWGRWRLEITRLKYVFDRDDPAARSLNTAVYESFREAARRMALQTKSIEKWHEEQ